MKNVFFLIFIFIISNEIMNAQGNIIAKKVMPSVVLIVMEDNNGQLLGLGSGFFITKNLIATNFHVIEGSSRGYIKLINSQKKINIEGVVSVDKIHDLVILSVDQEVAYLPLGNFNSVEIGENIYVVGNPKGLEGTFSQGIVSSIREIDGDKLLQITAPISPGSSGGPVLNAKGEVIGVSVATYKDGQNLNFAVPVSYLKPMMNNTKNLVSINSISTPSNSSITKKMGGKITEGVIGYLFNWFHTNGNDQYYFTVKNNLREDITNILIYVIFYDLDGNLFDTHILKYDEIIPSGLAKRVEQTRESGFVIQRKTTIGGNSEPKKYEIRIVDFEIVE